MTIKEFNTKIINEGFAQIDKHIVFQTPDGKVYTDVEIVSITQGNEVICKVKLTDKIKPKFKIDDVVTNASGLYPDVKCTISAVNYNEQYYCYKEVSGVTYFKDQDKLMLVDDIKPKFKAGDKVKGASSENPEKVFVINIVNTSNQCYHYFNSKGITTKFKDQDRLILVKEDEVRPPVEDETKFAEYILTAVKTVRTTKLKGSITFNIPKNIDTFKLGCKLSYNEDLKIGAELSNNGTDTITIKW